MWDPGSVPTLAYAGAHLRHGEWERFSLRIGREVLDLGQVGVIWLRRPTDTHAPASCPDEGIRELVDVETSWLLRGMWALMHVPWVNHPDRGRIASYKPLQLSIAAQVGLSVPRTYVGNDPDQVRNLASSCPNGVVVKTLQHPFISNRNKLEKILYTSRVSNAELEDDAAVSCCPSIWQEAIPKLTEIRVTVVGREVFGVEIDSQSGESGLPDWRMSATLEHRPYDMPNTLKQQCTELTRRMKLHFGAIDLILTPQQEYVFLEINPFGQWAWLQENCDIPIAEAHCRLFRSLVDGDDGMVPRGSSLVL